MNFNSNNPRRLTKRQTVRMLIAILLLVWATQTLLQQWGFGQDAPAQLQTAQPHFSDERFVPGTQRFDSGATIELRAEATVIGGEIKLKSICRWTDSDKSVLAPIGEMTLARFSNRTPFRSISVQEIKNTLQDAGVSLAAINFVGATACTVNRGDVEYDEQQALQQWIDAKQTAMADTSIQPSTQPVAAALLADRIEPDDKPVHTLRELLVQDIAERLNIPTETLQVTFRPQDEKALNLSQPQFKFDIQPQRVRDLGEVSWLVRLIADGNTAGDGVASGASQKIQISGTARAWQEQLVIAKPLPAKTILSDTDLIERRTLADHIPDQPLLTKSQAVGQQAARDLQAGIALTSRMVDPVQLIKPGQYVTIMLKQGSISLKTVAKSMESGSMGQTIRVKNEETRDVYQVTVTGPQSASLNAPETVENVASVGN
jgi:flagella basal body P-ring formation protein FlgA